MGRKLKPIFSKYEACTQTSLASTVYDGQPGDQVELHHVVYPAVRKVGGRSKVRKAQSAHGSSAYKKSGGYSKFEVKSQKLKPSQVDGLLDRFGRFLDKKKKSLTEARSKLVPQEVSQVPGQKVGLVVDEKTLYVDIVEVVDVQPSSEQSVSQPQNNGQLGFQSYVRGPGGFLPTTSGQWQSSASGSSGYQVDETSTFGFVPPPVEAVSSVLGVELTPEEATTVVSVGELAAALPFTRNPTLASSALPGSPEPVPNSWPSGQPDFQTLSDLELLDPLLEPWDLWGFDLDVARLEAAHPSVISGASDYDFVTDEVSKLPWEETDSEEEQGVGWGLHLGQEYWDIIPFLCDDGSR